MEQTFGYIILESAEENNTIEITEVIDKPNLCYVRFNTTLQSLDCINRNRRQYNGDALVQGLSDPNITELMRNNKWKGERDHPVTKDIQRIATVWSKESSHRINRWWREGTVIKGDISTLDDHMYGTALTRNILQGEIPSFSLRALAMLEKKGNITYVDKPPRIITYDEVNLPSHKEAYADKGSEKIILSDGKREKVYESTGIDLKNGAIAIEAKDIRDMIMDKSDNLKIVCESFDVNPEDFQITHGGKSLSVKTDMGIAIFSLENKLVREVVNFWR